MQDLVRFLTSSTDDLSTSLFVLSEDISESLELVPDAVRSFSVNNAGGTSQVSEAFSMTIISQLLAGYSLSFKLEMEIETSGIGLPDYVVFPSFTDASNFPRFGVSVTRAVTRHTLYLGRTYSKADAYTLFTKKLYGLINARSGTMGDSQFVKCILHVWAQSVDDINTLISAYLSIMDCLEEDHPIRDIVILISVCSWKGLYQEHLYQYTVKQ